MLTINPQSDLPLLMPFVFDQSQSGGMNVPLEVLAASEGHQETWAVDSSVTQSETDMAQLVSHPEYLLILIESQSRHIMDLTEASYQHAFDQAQAMSYPELIRTWNFFPDINQPENGMERYQHFCVARQMVLNQHPQFNGHNPAATAIGSHGADSSFVFVFAKTPGVGIENDRQVPAWQYPEQYAPKQPRFTRGMVHGGVLMCSGTASVVGHETLHVGDLEKQCGESLRNVKQVILQSKKNVSWREGVFRFYLRERADLPRLMPLIAEAGIKHYVVLLGDVCRENLLVECEAVFQIA